MESIIICFILIILAPPVVKCWILSAAYVHTCLTTLQKQTCGNPSWARSRFCRNKKPSRSSKSEALPSAERRPTDAGPSAGRRCAGRADNKRIHQQRRCKHGRTPATCTAFIASSTVKWNLGFGGFIQVDSTWLFRPSCWPTWRHFFLAAAVAWKQRCRGFVEKSLPN